MSWPTPQDYVEAVQNSAYAFDDPDLKGAQAEVSKLGLPKVISGQFACVFKFSSPGKAWAVRCFVREFADSHERYVEISKALKKENFPFTVKFEFIPHGIRVKGAWFPIIKMEWLSGQLLGNFIAANASSQATLVDIANQIAQMHAVLRQSRIAHGDLQHGNIIVNQGKLFLIDYDGMYVPGLSGKGSHEIGHRNYQHPFRQENDFNEGVDVFSVWIIYLSLIALSHDPSLWSKLQGGDDSILLKAKDFKEPYASAAFQVLKSHNNQIVQKIAFVIESLCYAELGALPSFNADEIAVVAALPKNPPIPVGDSGAWLGDWTKPQQAPAEEGTSGLGWVAGHIPIETPRFSQAQRSKTLPLLSAAGASFLAYLLPLFAGYSQLVLALIVQLLVAVPAMALLVRRYADEEAVKEKKRLQATKDGVESEISIKRGELTAHKAHIDVAVSEQKKIELANARDVSRIDTVLQATLKKIAEDGNRERQTLHGRKLAISSAEDTEKSSVQALCASKVNALKNEVNATNAQVNGELASELKKHQDRHLMNFLSRYRIVDANLSGIGEKLTARLHRAGIHTAADAGYYRVSAVDGIGHQKSGTIKQWRDGLVRKAHGSTPTSLDSQTEAQIRAKFTAATSGKVAQIRTLEQQRDAQIQVIVAKYKAQRDPVELSLRNIDAESARKSKDANAIAEKDRVALRASAIALTKGINDRLAEGQGASRKAEGEIGRLHYQLNISEKKLNAYQEIRFVRWLGHQIMSDSP